jgi:hypothetical protein
MWHTELREMVSDTIIYPLSRTLFFPDRLGSREGFGKSRRSAVAFRLPPRLDCRPGAAQSVPPSV